MVVFLQTFLPIIIYFLLIIMLVVGIVLGIKAINTMNKVEQVVDDVNKKVESLNGFFHIIDFTTDKIVSITPVGLIETYDIKCFAPNNNYVANNFVVHKFFLQNINNMILSSRILLREV